MKNKFNDDFYECKWAHEYGCMSRNAQLLQGYHDNPHKKVPPVISEHVHRFKKASF